MMLATLVLTFCTASPAGPQSPAEIGLVECISQRYPIDQPVQCLTGVSAQIISQDWLAQNPGYWLAGWHCDDADPV